MSNGNGKPSGVEATGGTPSTWKSVGGIGRSRGRSWHGAVQLGVSQVGGAMSRASPSYTTFASYWYVTVTTIRYVPVDSGFTTTACPFDPTPSEEPTCWPEGSST